MIMNSIIDLASNYKKINVYLNNGNAYKFYHSACKNYKLKQKAIPYSTLSSPP